MLLGGEPVRTDLGVIRTTTPSEGTMTMTTATTVGSRRTTKQKVGLVLCFLNSLMSLPSFLQGGPSSGENGPPEAVLILASVLGVVGCIATVIAWRGSGLALRIAAGTIIINT